MPQSPAFAPKCRLAISGLTCPELDSPGRAIITELLHKCIPCRTITSLIREISNLLCAPELEPGAFPFPNSTKSMIGHGWGASGAMECVATILQLHQGFVHPSINCEDLHQLLDPIRARVPAECVQAESSTALKVSFGFGDVNACVLFSRWQDPRGATND